MYFIELERFGWNWLTYSFITIFAITTVQYHANAVQAQKIWRARSAEALSLSTMTVIFFIYLAAFWYGLVVRSLTITYTGGLFIPCLFSTVGAWKFGQPNRTDWTLLWICTGSFTLFLSPINPAWIFGAFTVGSLVAMGIQIRKLYQVRRRGVLHGGWLLLNTIKNVVLLIFAFVSRDVVYMLSVPFYLTCSLWLLILWLRCPKSIFP